MARRREEPRTRRVAHRHARPNGGGAVLEWWRRSAVGGDSLSPRTGGEKEGGGDGSPSTGGATAGVGRDEDNVGGGTASPAMAYRASPVMAARRLLFVVVGDSGLCKRMRTARSGRGHLMHRPLVPVSSTNRY